MRARQHSIASRISSGTRTSPGAFLAVARAGAPARSRRLARSATVRPRPTTSGCSATSRTAAPGNYEVFWTCTNTARGCHNQACGFISLGIVGVPAHGQGKFTATKGNNPFPGNYVHLDLIGPDLLTAVYAGIPIGVGPAVGTSPRSPATPRPAKNHSHVSTLRVEHRLPGSTRECFAASRFGSWLGRLLRGASSGHVAEVRRCRRMHGRCRCRLGFVVVSRALHP